MNGRAEHPVESVLLRQWLSGRSASHSRSRTTPRRVLTLLRTCLPPAVWQVLLLRVANGWVSQSGVRHPAHGRVFVWGPRACDLRMQTRVWQMLPEFRAALMLMYTLGFEARPARRRLGVAPVLPRPGTAVTPRVAASPAGPHDWRLARQEWVLIAPHALDAPDWDSFPVEEENARRLAVREALAAGRWDMALSPPPRLLASLKCWPVPEDAPKLFRWATGYPPWRMELATWAMLPEEAGSPLAIPTHAEGLGEVDTVCGHRHPRRRFSASPGLSVTPRRPVKRRMGRRPPSGAQRLPSHPDTSQCKVSSILDIGAPSEVPPAPDPVVPPPVSAPE